MTGTEMEVEWDSACSEYVVNDALGRVMYENMSRLGDLRYSDEEKEYAMRYVRTLPDGSEKSVARLIKKSFPGIGDEKAETMASEPVQGELFPYEMSEEPMKGSTDVGDASWIAPTAQALVTGYPTGTAAHSWQWVASGKSPVAHKGMIYAAKAMAMTALDVIDDAEILKNAKG